MLQKIRDKTQGWFATVIIGAVCVTFALWGVHYYLQQGGPTTQTVAKVGSAKITAQQFNQAFQRFQQQQAASLGGAYSDDPEFQRQLKQQLLQQLVQQTLLERDLKAHGFVVASSQIDEVIVNMPAFQQNGQFSQALFNQVVNRLMFTPEQFYQQLHDQLLVGQLAMGVSASNFALPLDIKAAMLLLGETRDVGYMVLPLQHFIEQVNISDKQIADYYNQHQSAFMSSEQVQLQYIVLPATDKAGKNTANFSDLSDKLANLTYENPNSLQVASTQLNLPLQTTDYFSRTDKNLKGILASTDVINAAFSDDVLNQNYNSNVINLADGSVAVIRLANRKPAMPLPLAQVTPDIKAILAKDAASKQMQVVGQQLAKQLADGASGPDLAKQYQVVWKEKTDVNRHQENVNPLVLAKVFNLLVPKDRQHPTTQAIDLPASGNLAVVAVYQVQYGDPNKYTDDQKRAFEQQIANSYGHVDYALYMQSLMKQENVKINSAALDN